jgi:hypothetical protein
LVPTTHTFLEATTKQPETARNAVAGDDFKPVQAEFRPATKAACDYTKRPQVKGRPHRPTRPGCVELGLGTPIQRHQGPGLAARWPGQVDHV